MHYVGLVVQIASKLLSTELICMGQIWEEREVEEFAPGSPCFLDLPPRASLSPCQSGSRVKGWPQPGWWDCKAEPAESKGLKPALTLSAVSGPFACEGNRFPEAGL